MASPLAEFMQLLTSPLANNATIAIEIDDAAGHQRVLQQEEPQTERRSKTDEGIVDIWFGRQFGRRLNDESDQEKSLPSHRWQDQKEATHCGLASSPPRRPSRRTRRRRHSDPIVKTRSTAPVSKRRTTKKGTKSPPRMPLRRMSIGDSSKYSLSQALAAWQHERQKETC